ncbi:DNA/RNA nuclease SfsA [Geminicoccus roseus]|uniref:DNA/RNA nuclease SfsA n=1 Tax=Geminicoccus roseus TaxID=404900 RepID=UPI00047F133D|nr:DNA/RNA nuclease SfsA [Geminicoccus roseus]
MLLPQPLYPATLMRRYKRFLADLRLEDGREVTAHLADPGRLPELSRPGLRAWLSFHDEPRRRLPWSLQLIQAPDGALVGMNTAAPNRLVAEALAEGRIPQLGPIRQVVAESVPAVGTRLDFRCTMEDGRTLWLEVKGVTWRRGNRLAFPDAVTARGTRHLRELARLAEAGDRAVLLFVAQRADGVALEIARDIDPAYDAALALAMAAGVQVLAFRCAVSTTEVVLDEILPMV